MAAPRWMQTSPVMFFKAIPSSPDTIADGLGTLLDSVVEVGLFTNLPDPAARYQIPSGSEFFGNGYARVALLPGWMTREDPAVTGEPYRFTLEQQLDFFFTDSELQLSPINGLKLLDEFAAVVAIVQFPKWFRRLPPGGGYRYDQETGLVLSVGLDCVIRASVRIGFAPAP